MNAKQLADQLIEAVRDFVSRATAPLQERLKALEDRPAPEKGDPGPRGEKGDPGERGAEGPAGLSVKASDVAQVILDVPTARELLRGEPGHDGADGKSVTLEEVRTYLDAELATWALGFERRAQDVLARAIDKIPPSKDGRDGRDGTDGRDGFSLEDLQVEQRDERTIVLRFVRGELVREHVIHLGHPLDQGVFREGATYAKGDGVTFGGSWWIAQKDDPQGRPGMSADWRLAVKKGRDGRGTP